MVTDLKARDALANLRDDPGGVRGWDDVVLDGEGILGRGDCDVPVVEGDAMDLDLDLVLGGLGDVLLVRLHVAHGGALLVKTDDTLRHL